MENLITEFQDRTIRILMKARQQSYSCEMQGESLNWINVCWGKGFSFGYYFLFLKFPAGRTDSNKN
jgi:hypothetical protein